MIKNLKINNFTLFTNSNLTFGSGVNLFIGENGTGKTHILKLLYSIAAVLGEGRQAAETPTKNYFQKALALKLRRVFRPDQLGRLANRKPGRNRCDIQC